MGKANIFADSLLSISQLVVVINNSTQDPVVCPPQDAETKRALQPDNNFSWVDDVEQLDASLCEQNSEEHQGPGAQDILHSPVETTIQEVSGDGVNMSSKYSEPDNLLDIVLEAQHRASLQVTLNCFSGRGSQPQGDSTISLGYVSERMLWE